MPIGAAFSLWKKSVFIKHAVNSLSLSPLGHSDSFASCKAWCVLISASLPKTHFPVKGCVCFVGFASLQSLWAYTPGIRAGAECGAAALTPLGATPQTPFLITIDFFQQKSNPPSTVNSVTADNLIFKRIFNHIASRFNVQLFILYVPLSSRYSIFALR